MILELDMQYLDLAIKEIESVAGKIVHLKDNYYLAKLKPENLGLTKTAYKELGTINKIKKVKGSFAARSHDDISDKKFAGMIWNKTDKKVDLKNPDNELHLINGLVAKKVWQRKNSEIRKSHNRKYNHPTSLDPNLSRAMINIARTKTVFDPFCGAGGILLEGKLMKKKIRGYDIDPMQVRRANKNLEKNVVRQADSFKKKWNKTIITDLPYGRNSKMEKDFYNKFFNKVKSCKRAVIGIDAKIKIPEHVEFETIIYLHKSLSKRIIVLSR